MHGHPIKYICMTTIAYEYPILLISCFAPFFLSLFFVRNKLNSLLNPHHLFPQIHTNTNTPTHTHTHRNTQINHHRGCLVLVLCPGQALRVELLSYEDEFNSMGQSSEYLKGVVDFGSKSKETQRRRGVPWIEEEHRYKILIVFLFWG